MNSLELGLLKSIHDPIHGTIKLSKLEMNIIEHPLFRRLHNVRQNSFLYKVFPSAKHTRFEHSIGVMHLAGKMFTAVLENGYIADVRGDIATDATFKSYLSGIEDETKYLKGVGVNLYKLLLENSSGLDVKKLFEELRLAALLHDIGHGPLSHLFDAFAPTIDEFLLILQSDERLCKNKVIFEALKGMVKKYQEEKVKKGKDNIRIEHEHVSSYFTFVLLSDLEVDVNTICNIMTILKPELSIGHIALKHNELECEINLVQLLNDLVASAPIDCDRMDYLKRDSYFSGVPYGNYSEDRVLKTLLAYVVRDDSNTEIRLGLKTSGLHTVENFLQARYELYVQVYGHKTNEACNAMLENLKAENLSFTTWATDNLSTEEFIKLYVSTSDDKFLEKLLKSPTLSSDARETIERLNNRSLWKRIYEVEEFIEHGVEDSVLHTTFQKCFDEMNCVNQNTLKNYTGKRFPLKDVDSGAKLLEKTSQKYYVLSDTKLSTASQIISSLNKGLNVHRIYSPDSSIEKIRTYKEYAKQVIHPQIQTAKVGAERN